MLSGSVILHTSEYPLSNNNTSKICQRKYLKWGANKDVKDSWMNKLMEKCLELESDWVRGASLYDLNPGLGLAKAF